MNGKVYLVGAGPGDPDLLTLKALRLLKTADAVLHDDLVSREILSLIPPVAQLYNVGKRCGTKTISQTEINFLMTTLATSGLAVVRLKSGDPLIFGRCGEEIEALRRASIEFEIVPGITAALGATAAAQIPLTHRHLSHAVVFLPGHAAAFDDGSWKNLVCSGATLAVYMPGPNYFELSRRLMRCGMAAQTPCAVISAVSTSHQQTHLSTVEKLGDFQSVPSPSLVIVGDIVNLARDAQPNPYSLDMAPAFVESPPVAAKEQP